MSFQSFLGGFFSPVCEIDVILNDAETRKTAEIKTEDGKVEKHFLFYDGESVSGKVTLGFLFFFFFEWQLITALIANAYRK